MKNPSLKIVDNKNIKETFWAFLSKGSIFLFFYLIQLFFIENMSVEQWGKWSLFISILNIVTLCSILGINISVQKFVAQYNNTKHFKPVLFTSIKLRAIGSTVYLILVLVLVKPLLLFFNKSDLICLFYWSVPYIFFWGIIDFFNSIFQGVHRLKYSALIKFYEHGIKLLVVIILFAFHKRLYVIGSAFSISYFITFLISIFFFYKVIYKDAGGRGEVDYTGQILKYSLPLFMMTTGAFISIEIDTIMLNALKGDYETGIYSTAKQLLRQVPHISIAFAAGIMPIFAKMNNDNKVEMKKKFDKWFRMNFGVLSIILIISVSLSPFILPWFFKNKYNESILSFQILSPYIFMMGVSIFTGAFLDYRGLAKKRAINLFITIALNVVLNYFFIKKYGAVGASIATTVSHIPYFLLNLYEVRIAFR